MAEVCGTLNMATGRLVSLIAEVLDTGAWEGWGIRSPEQWVSWKCGLSSGRARRLVAVARRLPELPATRSALQAGELAEDQVAQVCRHAPVWADAFVAMAERSLGAEVSLRPARDRHVVLVHLRGDDHGLSAQLHLGPRLPDAIRRLLGCDGRVRPVTEVTGTPVSVGRAQRIVSDRTRVAVEDRDGGCRVPGCDRTRWLEVHHIAHWEDGGLTDSANLVALCGRHHRLHHLGQLAIEGDADVPDGLAFTDARGRRLTGCGRPAPPGELRFGGTWVHPTGERLESRWVYFNEPARAPA